MRAGIARLLKRIDDVKAFDPRTITEQFTIPQVEALAAAVDDALVRTFGHETIEYNRYAEAAQFDNGPYNYAYEVPIHEVHQSLQCSKLRSVALLEQAVKSLEERLGEEAGLVNANHAEPQRDLSKVFVVHGHDQAVRETVARFIEKLGFEAIILHERPNKGRTIITKFREEAAGVGFAVVLMTPDDVGGLPVSAADHLRPRARQNVVFELGFFIGALGPEHVAALVKGNIERPSDFDGVVYISLDDGSWKADLARELGAAGYEIDWNKAMRQ